jgi:hypothetical protein
MMVQTLAISENLTLKYLRESFNLTWVQEPDFFPEWQAALPVPTEAQQQALNRVRDRYFHQLDEGSMLENDDWLALAGSSGLLRSALLLSFRAFGGGEY